MVGIERGSGHEGSVIRQDVRTILQIERFHCRCVSCK